MSQQQREAGGEVQIQVNFYTGQFNRETERKYVDHQIRCTRKKRGTKEKRPEKRDKLFVAIAHPLQRRSEVSIRARNKKNGSYRFGSIIFIPPFSRV